MIVTVTINPAIDRIFSVDRLAFEDRGYITASRESAGGRGLNASCVIHSFGGKTLAVHISGGETGKRLDFLLQELNREANTVLSKSTDLSIKEAALVIKGEVEKLREQVQNVE